MLSARPWMTMAIAVAGYSLCTPMLLAGENGSPPGRNGQDRLATAEKSPLKQGIPVDSRPASAGGKTTTAADGSLQAKEKGNSPAVRFILFLQILRSPK